MCLPEKCEEAGRIRPRGGNRSRERGSGPVELLARPGAPEFRFAAECDIAERIGGGRVRESGLEFESGHGLDRGDVVFVDFERGGVRGQRFFCAACFLKCECEVHAGVGVAGEHFLGPSTRRSSRDAQWSASMKISLMTRCVAWSNTNRIEQGRRAQSSGTRFGAYQSSIAIVAPMLLPLEVC